MKLPTFLIIGVQKAGTTSIYGHLNQHPQVYMSPVKEVGFLERDWQRAYQEGVTPKPSRIDTLEKYHRLFEGATDEIAMGEVSPNYLFHHQESVDLVHTHLPTATLIAVLRNPTDRAYSDYLMHVRDATGQPLSLAEQVRQKPDTSFTLRKGLYFEGIQHFMEVFGRDRIRVYLYDDLSRDTLAFMQRLYRDIGVDDQFTPDTAKRQQRTEVPKNQTLNTLIKTQNPIRSGVSSVLRVVLPQTVRQNLRSRLISLNQSQSKPVMPEADRALLQDYYRENILKLQDLIQQDLSHWLGDSVKG